MHRSKPTTTGTEIRILGDNPDMSRFGDPLRMFIVSDGACSAASAFSTIYLAKMNTSQVERLRMLQGAFSLQGCHRGPVDR
jgi:hypothetical protein